MKAFNEFKAAIFERTRTEYKRLVAAGYRHNNIKAGLMDNYMRNCMMHVLKPDGATAFNMMGELDRFIDGLEG